MYIQTVCNDSDFFKRRIIQRIAVRELIESLQKKVRKGQVSGTSSLVYAYALHMPMPSSRAYPLLSAVCMYYSTYVSTARPVMYWAPNKQKRFMTNCSQGIIHTLRKQVFRLFEPNLPLSKHVFSTENKQKMPFSNPPSPLPVLT